jgi:septal ring factor EnvC (AmiA/AmiB activator)
MKGVSSIAGTIISWLLLAGLLTPAWCFAEDGLDSSRQRLDQIQQQIKETLTGLRSKQSEHGSLSQDLEKLDVEVRHIERLTKKSNRQLSELSEKLKKQRQLLDEIETLRNQTEKQVRHRLVVLYKSGEVGLIRALLSESERPHDITEKYAFLSRMVRHDRELLSTYRQQSQEHRLALSELETLRKKQSAVVLRRRKEQDTLQRAKKSKKVLLASVKQDAELLEGVLENLRAKAARLSELVKKLETAESQPYTEDLKGLLPQKGRLLWPVAGKLRVGFGTHRHGDLGTLIESNGFDIEAAAGSPVNAAAAGKVIFANTLRGYGKLIIMDHGQKYYTLYAHMARFTKQVGDYVAAGDIMAYSGFEGRDAVYFEVRQGGKPLNPADWLIKR